MEIFEQLGRIELRIDADEMAALGDTKAPELTTLQCRQHHGLVVTPSDTDTENDTDTYDAMLTSLDWGWGEVRQDGFSVSGVSETRISVMTRPHGKTLEKGLQLLLAQRI